MGNSPTGTDTTPDETDEQEPQPRPDPDQPTFDDYEPESGTEETSTSPSSGAGLGAGASAGASAGTAAGAAAGPGMTAAGTSAQDSVPENQEDDEEDLNSETPDIDTFQDQSDDEYPDNAEDTEETKESEENDTEDEDDDEEDQEAKFVISTDPWDTTGWGNEPALRRIEEMFGDKVAIRYAPLPPRNVETWDTNNSMPTAESPDLPDSTTTSHKALRAAAKQDNGRAYLRRLRIAVQAEGRNIEHKETLTDLAVDVGLNPEQLRNDMAKIETEDPQTIQETPQMTVRIGDVSHFWTENIEYERIYARMMGEGVKPRPHNRPLRVFVRDNALVSTAEVMEAYQLDRTQAVTKLNNNDHISRVNLDSGEFWTTNR
jgi:putative protein-disulfide isomerase